MEDSYQPALPNESHESRAIAKPVPLPILDADLDTTSFDQSSVHKTINTPELLEQILSHLPLFDLCRARLTGQLFRNLIDRSLMLQKHLFLVPYARTPSWTEPTDAPSWIGWADSATCLLIDRRDFEIAQNPELHPTSIYRDDPDIRPSSHFHPILDLDNVPRNLKSDFQIQLNILYLRTDTSNEFPAFARAFCQFPKLTQTFDNVSGLPKDSPIHRMFLTNPPIKEVEFTIRIPFWDAWQEWVDLESVTKGCDPMGTFGIHSLTSDTGITFGQLFEYTEEAVRGQEKRILPDPLPEMDYWRDPYP